MTLRFDPIKNKFIDDALGNGVDARILYGVGEPTESLGRIGDFYIETESLEIYQKTSAGWGEGISLKGGDGKDGEDGEDGIPGVPGRNGVDGVGIAKIEQLSKDKITVTLTSGELHDFELPAPIDGSDGQDGRDGLSVELRTVGEKVEWRRDGEDWQILFEIPKPPISMMGGGGGSRKLRDLRDTKITEEVADQLLKFDGYNWVNSTVAFGTVTSVAVSASDGIGVSGSPITSSGTIALSLGDITPNSVVAAGTVTGSNLSGTNTGDQTDQTLPFTDNTTNNASTTKHGFLPKLSGNSGDVFFGNGTFGSLAIATATSNQPFAAQTSVSVTHNLGYFPLVQISDSGGQRVVPLEITDNSTNQFTVTFTTATTGTIIYR